jgi:hypothetical protein
MCQRFFRRDAAARSAQPAVGGGGRLAAPAPPDAAVDRPGAPLCVVSGRGAKRSGLPWLGCRAGRWSGRRGAAVWLLRGLATSCRDRRRS